MMKLLWVSNSPIGPAADVLGHNYGGSSGGWIQTEYDNIEKDGIEFFFLCTLPSIKKREVIKKSNEKGTAYCINAPKISSGITISRSRQLLIQKIVDEIQPDIIHIWGTETWLSNAVAKTISDAHKIIFIQGLIGVHQRYLGGYFKNNIFNETFNNPHTLTDSIKKWIRNTGFRKQALVEKDTIGLCKNTIIDSRFVRSYCKSITEHVQCYNHVLKPNKVFYQTEWSYEDCEKNSIFTIYGSNAEKGTHNLLWAIYILKKQFPDIKVYIPGAFELDQNGCLSKTRNNAYQNLLYDIIQRLNLYNNIFFTGRLDANQMAKKMRKCNVFVNTSCMEVHALSLREAMVVGLPCITSLCGSVSEYVQNGVNGLIYRYEEYETLAALIGELLTDKDMAVSISEKGKMVFRSKSHTELSLNRIYEQLTN